MTAQAYIQDYEKERRPSTVRAAKLAVGGFDQWRKGRPNQNLDTAVVGI